MMPAFDTQGRIGKGARLGASSTTGRKLLRLGDSVHTFGPSPARRPTVLACPGNPICQSYKRRRLGGEKRRRSRFKSSSSETATIPAGKKNWGAVRERLPAGTAEDHPVLAARRTTASPFWHLPVVLNWLRRGFPYGVDFPGYERQFRTSGTSSRKALSAEGRSGRTRTYCADDDPK